MLINEGRISSHGLSPVQQPVWTTSFRENKTTVFDEALDTSFAVREFLNLTDAAQATLSAGGGGAVALARCRGISKYSSGALSLDSLSGQSAGDEQAAWRQKAVLSELSDFLAARLARLAWPTHPGLRLNATAPFGTFTLLLWQPDCTAEELSSRLRIWREEYRMLKHSDFVAGIAAAPENSRDLLSLISSADETLTEAHSARRIICFSPTPVSTLATHFSRRPTLLIVDDNHDQVEILDLIMQRHSYQTLRAYNGEEALNAVTRYNPDLLLLDVGMPELDGFHVMSRLRDLNGGRLDLPVIMITGSDAEESVRRGFELGARDYVIKPCDPHDLLSRIQTILSVSSRQ
jgi:CheY-like chemotaxis protein